MAGATRPGYRLGVDIGGTFTDMVLIGDDDSVFTLKLLSSPPDFGRSVIAGLSRLLDDAGIEPGQIHAILHGTTVATNAILEARGAPTALVTTKGFRDVLELGRMRRPSLYDMTWQKPLPLVPRRLRFELDFRLDHTGAVIQPLSPDELPALAARLRDANVASVAVCFINSYANPALERETAEELRRLLPGVAISSSADILPEIKEYERTSTTVVNAYVQPLVDAYIRDLERDLRTAGTSAHLQIMQSSGGLIGASAARLKPVQMIESGPAAGVIAVRDLARRTNRLNVVAFDMGGTTAKASLIENGEWFDAPEYEVGGGMNAGHGLAGGGGYVIRVPSIDISEVGAGGGSICWVDDGGGARVGPRSAGASPGPACYGRGGELPTLTDANVVLGYLSPAALAGGSLAIRPELARAALQSRFAGPLGLDLHEAAFGAYRIAVAAMSKAVKAVTSQRGRDPRDFALVAFGGAGPMYGAAMAEEFQIDTVLIPPGPGLFSAIGLLVAEIQQNAVASLNKRADPSASDLAAQFANLESELLRRFADSGHTGGPVVLDRYADIRYRGQSSELRVPVPPGAIEPATLALLAERFADEHERSYGHRGTGQRLEILNLRIKAHAPQTGAGGSNLTRLAGPKVPPGTSRQAYFGRDNGFLPTRIIDRSSLAGGAIAGPAIVEEMDATTLVPPGWRASLDASGTIVLERIR